MVCCHYGIAVAASVQSAAVFRSRGWQWDGHVNARLDRECGLVRPWSSMTERGIAHPDGVWVVNLNFAKIQFAACVLPEVVYVSLSLLIRGAIVVSCPRCDRFAFSLARPSLARRS